MRRHLRVNGSDDPRCNRSCDFRKAPRSSRIRDLWGMASYACPEETLREPYVDIVVRGQGEITITEVAMRSRGKKPLDLIAGISWKKDGRLIENFERRIQPIDTFAPPAFDLTDFDAYERATGKRKLAYATSVGCPYACNYCTDMVVYKRKFNAYTAEHVVAELTDSCGDIAFNMWPSSTPIFPSISSRAIAIASGIRESNVKFSWTFQASTDFICRMSQDEVQLLADSGVSYMGFGTESTSAAVLKMMNKRHQRVNEMYETARKTNLAGIRINFNLILGYPGETEDDQTHHLPDNERHRPPVSQCSLLPKYLYSISWYSNLAPASRTGSA